MELSHIKNNKYLKHVKGSGEIATYTLLIIIMSRQWLDELQVDLNDKLNMQLAADGIIGINTLSALDKMLMKDHSYLGAFVSNMFNHQIKGVSSDPIESLKVPLLNFLAEAEGTRVHINGGTETRYTTPYGIYAKSFPTSEPVKYVDSLFSKYGLNKYNSHDIYKINHFIKPNEKLHIQDLAWEFYKKTFMNKGILILLNEQTALTYLSIAINGGRSRGNRAIQSAIGATIDGVVGKQTLGILDKKITSDGPEIINFGMLEYMILFYARLINKNNKFRKYINGWYNRLVKTSCYRFRAKYNRIPV